jgi:hypothetical protein
VTGPATAEHVDHALAAMRRGPMDEDELAAVKADEEKRQAAAAKRKATIEASAQWLRWRALR